VLRPRKAKEFIPEVAQKTEMSEDTVSTVLSYYWQEVRKSMSALKHSRIHLTNLGDFVIKHWKMDDKIQMLEQFEEKNKQKGLQQMTARFKTAETLYDLKNLKKIMEEEQQRAEFIKMHKRTSYESKRERDQNLEEQGSDS
jgi:nucleoid DNA-binding protein